jgi:hypothetical protein
MAEESKPAALSPVPVRLMRSKDFRVAFSNTFRFRTSATDVGIAFGYQSEIPSATPNGPDQNIITDEVEVVLTPFTLKLLQLAINDNLEAIEAAQGKPVELPQEILDALAEQKEKVKSDVAAKRMVNLKPVT